MLRHIYPNKNGLIFRSNIYFNLFLALLPSSALLSRRFNAIVVFLTIVYAVFCFFRYRPVLKYSKLFVYLSFALFFFILLDFIKTGNYLTNWHFTEQKLSLVIAAVSYQCTYIHANFQFQNF